jgi:hypothetical protein
MLAQNFKTPADLEISDQEFSALITVLGMLDREELLLSPDYRPGVPNAFNMNFAGMQHDCGSAACIGGWVARLANLGSGSNYVGSSRHRPVGRLYWPRALSGRKSWQNITVPQAAAALRSFLTTGHPRWREVVSR